MNTTLVIALMVGVVLTLISRKLIQYEYRWYKGYTWKWNLVQFIINNELIKANGRFKVGDQVRYNWRAKIQILSILSGEVGITHTIEELWYNDHSYARLSNQKGCDVFWLRKAYIWERNNKLNRLINKIKSWLKK